MSNGLLIFKKLNKDYIKMYIEKENIIEIFYYTFCIYHHYLYLWVKSLVKNVKEHLAVTA